MNKRVGWPVVALVLVLLVVGLYAYYHFVFVRSYPPINTAADIPPRKPGDLKPAAPPPGVQVPGSMRR
jgi:hypothetical protein